MPCQTVPMPFKLVLEPSSRFLCPSMVLLSCRLVPSDIVKSACCYAAGQVSQCIMYDSPKFVMAPLLRCALPVDSKATHTHDSCCTQVNCQRQNFCCRHGTYLSTLPVINLCSDCTCLMIYSALVLLPDHMVFVTGSIGSQQPLPLHAPVGCAALVNLHGLQLHCTPPMP